MRAIISIGIAIELRALQLFKQIFALPFIVAHPLCMQRATRHTADLPLL